MRLKSRQNGQGLLEVVIGIGIIVSGTVGSITLISATVNAGRSTNNKVIAAGLAREGIEVVRNLRDTNWLKIQSNEDVDAGTAGIQLAKSFDGIFNNTNKLHYAIPVFDQAATSNWTIFNFAPVGAGVTELDKAFSTTSCNARKCSIVYTNANGYFQKDTGSFNTTKFNRVLELHPICRVDNVPVGGDGIPDAPASEERIVNTSYLPAIPNPYNKSCSNAFGPTWMMVGLQVIANVRWTEGSRPESSYRLEERLYNWKYVQ